MTCYKYTVWCIPVFNTDWKGNVTGCVNVHELFDLGLDPYEINNRYPQLTAANTTAQRLISRLDAALTVLAYCRGLSCRNPWHVLHGVNGGVDTLEDAMDPRLDGWYQGRTRFSFRACALYYDPANEAADSAILLAMASG